MKTIVFENYKDLARDMIEESGHKKTICAFCLYDVTCKLIKELLMQDSNIEIRQIIIHDYEYSGYDKEYQKQLKESGVEITDKQKEQVRADIKKWANFYLNKHYKYNQIYLYLEIYQIY